MNYRVEHNTTYRYTTPAEACHNMVRLSPRTMPGQTCLGTTLAIDPAPATVHSHVDYFGNRVHSFAVMEPHETLSITSTCKVRVGRPLATLADSPAWNEVPSHLHTVRDDPTIDALQYVYDSRYIRAGVALRNFASASFPAGRPLLQAVLHLTTRIFKDFTYDPKATTIDTSVDVVLNRRRGVCQDFAHLEIACMRSLGLAARYVSGYVRTKPLPGQPRLTGADASHAWLSVYCPVNGWFDFDPTNGGIVADDHVTLAWGRDYHDVSPVKGIVLGAAGSEMSISVDVVEV